MEDDMKIGKRSKKKFLAFFTVAAVSLFLLGFTQFGCKTSDERSFRFVFATDIHIQPENRAVEGFTKAITHINHLNPQPQFVITGGDHIMKEEDTDFERADMLFNLFQSTSKIFEMPVYYTIGNGDIFGWPEIKGVDSSHPEFGKEMFKKRLGEGKTYRSFDYGGWHFILLDSIEKEEGIVYHGYINDEQFEWLKEDLEETGIERPICIALHIPLVSMITQIYLEALPPSTNKMLVNNGAEVIKLLSKYNVRLVLQGHHHIFEEHKYMLTTYITAGAVCGSWWYGPNRGHPEGFVIVDVKGNDFTLKYEPYGWVAEKEERE